MIFYKHGQSERELANKYESATKKPKVIMLVLKCESNIHEVIEETADCGNTPHAAPREPLHVQPEELSEANLSI